MPPSGKHSLQYNQADKPTLVVSSVSSLTNIDDRAVVLFGQACLVLEEFDVVQGGRCLGGEPKHIPVPHSVIWVCVLGLHYGCHGRPSVLSVQSISCHRSKRANRDRTVVAVVALPLVNMGVKWVR